MKRFDEALWFHGLTVINGKLVEDPFETYRLIARSYDEISCL